MRKLHIIHLDTSSSKIGFAFDKPNDKIAIFNCLVTECLDRHAPLKRIKMTQPPVPWLNDQSIGSLQVNLANQPQEAHARPLKEGEWNMFRYTLNKLKNLIKKAKRSFMITVLSSKQPKEVWRIHCILHPSQQLLHVEPDNLKRHFALMARHVTALSAVLIYWLIDCLTDDSHSSFCFCHVANQEVFREIKELQSDCLTGLNNSEVLA